MEEEIKRLQEMIAVWRSMLERGQPPLLAEYIKKSIQEAEDRMTELVEEHRHFPVKVGAKTRFFRPSGLGELSTNFDTSFTYCARCFEVLEVHNPIPIRAVAAWQGIPHKGVTK